MDRTRRGYFLISFVFVIITVALMARLYWARPVIFLGKRLWGGYPKQILETLDGKNPNAAYAPEGLEAPLLELRPLAGGVVRIIVIEGEFTDDAILPLKLWKKYLQNGTYLIVNSVDEKQDIYVSEHSLAGYVGKGCKLDDYVGQLLNVGEVRPHSCDSGTYSQLFGHGEVANAAIVLIDPANIDRPPCWEKPNNSQYRDCINDAVLISLQHIFGADHSSDLDAPVMVMPALGTGFGKLEKDDFYKDLFAGLGKTLRERKSPWTMDLLLLVNRQSDDWENTKKSIAQRLGDMAYSWGRTGSEGNAVDIWFMCGISLAMSLLFLSFGLSPDGTSRYWLGSLLSLNPITLSIGWFSAAAGLVTIMKQGVLLFDAHLPGAIYGLAGILAALLCVPLLRSLATFQKQI